MFKSQRDFLKLLEKHGELKEITIPIDVSRGNNELMALSRHLSLNELPVVKLTNLSNYNTPNVPVYIGNIGTRRRLCLAMESDNWREAKEKLVDVVNTPISEWPSPVIVDDAVCKEVIIPEDQVDLQKQIPKTWFGEEWSAMISDNVSITKDPETKNIHASCLLHSLLDKKPDGSEYDDELKKKYLLSYIFWNPPAGMHIGEIYAKSVKKKQNLEIAIAVCVDPQFLIIGGGPRCPKDKHEWDKFAMTGTLRKEPLEVVKCETVDLYVPASAEWVLEGEVLFDRELYDYKHANFLGFYNDFQKLPVTKIKCITHRKNPFWHPTRSFIPPYDHGYLQLLTVESETLSHLRKQFPLIKDVAVHPSFGGRGTFYVIQLSVDGNDKPYPWFGHQVIHAVWGSPGKYGAAAKYVFVVGPDINPYDANEVIWALNTRVQPKSDTIFNEKGQVHAFDPSAPITQQGNTLISEQMGIDATFKVPERFEKLHSVPARPSEEDLEKIKKKIAHLF